MASIFWNAKAPRKNATSNYDSAANWNPQGVPTAVDTAFFSSGSRARKISISNDDSVGGWSISTPGYTFTIKATGGMEFVGNGISGGATIINNNELTFINSSKVGFSTIVTNNHGTTVLKDTAESENARFTTNAGGKVDFSGVTGPLLVRSIAGAGTYYLGDNLLQVGEDDYSGTVTGSIRDGDQLGAGVGASLTKVGTGVLTLAGHNTFSGGTQLNGGTLFVVTSDGAGTGDIDFNDGSQTLMLKKTAFVTNSFATEIHDFGAGDFIILSGVKFRPGASAVYNDGTDVLDITSGAVTVHLTLIDPQLTNFKVVAYGKAGIKVFEVGIPVTGGPNATLNGTAAVEDFQGVGANNTVSYHNAPVGVIASLAAPQDNTEWAQGDLYTNIQHLTGSAHNDFLTGDAKANVLTGLGGTNTLDGGAGNDTLVSTSGLDILKGGKGADQFRLDNLLQGADPWGAIYDFSRQQRDKIDLRGLETTLGFQLHFVGHDNNFTGVQGELGYDFSDSGVTLSINIDGDTPPELYFDVYGPNIYDLKASDFLL